MPGGKGKRDKLYHEWAQHSGLPEDAIPLEGDDEDEAPEERPLRRVLRPRAPAGFNLDQLPDSFWLLVLLGASVVLSVVNLVLLAITVYMLTNFVK